MWEISGAGPIQMPVAASVGHSVSSRRDNGLVHMSCIVRMCAARNRIRVELDLL
jgi:hypothetical protein